MSSPPANADDATRDGAYALAIAAVEVAEGLDNAHSRLIISVCSQGNHTGGRMIRRRWSVCASVACVGLLVAGCGGNSASPTSNVYVYSANVEAPPGSGSAQPCPAPLHFGATVEATGDGTISYRWEFSDGSQTAQENLSVSVPSFVRLTTRVSSANMTANAPGQVWAHLRVLSPTSVIGAATYTVACYN